MAVAHAGDMAGHGHSHGPVRSEPRSPWLHGSWLRALWVSFLFAFIAIGISAFIRYLLGDPLHGAEMQEVAATFGLTFWAIGFTVGIGCFDYWWGYIIGSPNWVQEDHSAHGAYSWRDYFKVNTDHKVIGIQYLVLTFIFFMIGGALAEGVRAELASPGTQYFSPGTYNGLFSAHATLMIFLFVIPSFAGIANFVVPLMLGAQDMAFPRLNALSFWLLLPGGLIFLASFAVGPFDAGWTNYAPLSVHAPIGDTFFTIGVQFAGASSIATAVNFLVTIVTMRAPGMSFWRMPLLVWANLATSSLVVLGTPFIAGSQFMVLYDRVMHTHFFDPAYGGNVILYQHIFWFYSHPAVYIMMLPGFGIISEIISIHSRKPIFGYRLIAFSTVAIGVLGFTVWAHHMFVSGMAPWLRIPMMATTMLIAVPTGIKIFSWVATLWDGVIHLTTAMLFALGFIFTFVIGGLSGIFLAVLPVDINVSDTYFVVAHIHYVLFGGSVFTIYAGLYHWFPKMTGRMYDERLGRLHFWLTFVAFNATFMPMHWLGLQGMPRRVADYDPRFATLNFIISIFAFVLGRIDAGVPLQRDPQLGTRPDRPRQPVAGADARVAGQLAAADLQLRRAAAGRGRPVRVRRARRPPRDRDRARAGSAVHRGGHGHRGGRVDAAEGGALDRDEAHPGGRQPDGRRRRADRRRAPAGRQRAGAGDGDLPAERSRRRLGDR